ncbi:MAG: hypothetical protein HY927_13520 [Elusimicrobia bacterium]|nr:hypothetical protein [Elusimicrobiota bacterium]
MAPEDQPPSAYDFETLSREIVVSRLRDAEDHPAAAAKTARDIILPALRSTFPSQAPRLTTIQVCRGIVTGSFFIDKDIAATVIAVLEMTAEIAHEGNLEPSEIMTWAMEGVASVMAVVGANTQYAVQTAIEERFMGAGAIFGELCQKSLDPPP